MLSDSDAVAMEEWVTAADSWARSAQTLVGTASGLGTASRSLADRLGGPPGAPAAAGPSESRNGLRTNLLALADEVEDETAGLRDRYLATAASIEEFRQILDG